MAKKKTTVVEEETPEVNYKDVQDNSLTDIVTGKDKPKEETPEAKVETKEEEVAFDPEAFKKEVTEEAAKISEAKAQALIEATTGRKEPQKEEDQELISPWAKEKRTPKDYEEVADWALAKKDILDKRREAEQAKQEEEQGKVAEQVKQKQIEDFNKFTDEQLGDLYAANKLPQVGDPKNENDPGVIARRALFQTMLDVNVARQKEGKAPIYSIKEIYYEHYKPPTNQQPAGADAPVSAGRMGGGDESREIDYLKDIQPKRKLTDWLMDTLTRKQ